MGLKCAPDFAQQTMENLLQGIDNSELYLDDIGCFFNEWKQNLKLLEWVLTELKANRFMINPRKWKWAVQETDWLGYWLTPKGLKPWREKIDTILRVDRSRNLKQMQSFLGAVNYYRDIWPKWAHILLPLSDKSGKKTFHWSDEMDKEFKQMKVILSVDTLMTYPNHNKSFHIYTDEFDYQMGAVIMQDEKPVAYCLEN